MLVYLSVAHCPVCWPVTPVTCVLYLSLCQVSGGSQKFVFINYRVDNVNTTIQGFWLLASLFGRQFTLSTHLVSIYWAARLQMEFKVKILKI